MCNKAKHKHRKYFCMDYLQCFSREEILTSNREGCLEINWKQSTRMPDKGSTGYQKQLKAPLVIYVNFKSIVKKFRKLVGIIQMSHILIKSKSILLVVIDTKLYVLMTDLVRLIKNIEVKMQFIH